MGLRVLATCVALCLAALGCGGVKAPENSPDRAQGCSRVPENQVRLDVVGGAIMVDFEPAEFEVERDAIWKWINDAARAVTTYYGHFPVARCDLRITATDGRGVHFGQAFRRSSVPTVSMLLGRETRAEDLADDWTLTHEMVHLAFPGVEDSHHWIEEGLATYVEPIARFKIGLRTEESVWKEWVESMPNGQPEAGDRGLDFTPTWGRVYWGGALFALVTDVEIRHESGNRRGLRQALQGIIDAGGTMNTSWSITRAFAIGDGATRTHVLSTQYQKRRAAPEPVNLDELWAKLGVRLEGGKVVLDDGAPWSAIRRSILRD